LSALARGAATRTPSAMAADALAAFRSLMLLSTSTMPRPVTRCSGWPRRWPTVATARRDPRLLAVEAKILTIFAICSALWRSRRVPAVASRTRGRGRRRGRPQPAEIHARRPGAPGCLLGRPAGVFRSSFRRTWPTTGVRRPRAVARPWTGAYRFSSPPRRRVLCRSCRRLLQGLLNHPDRCRIEALDDYRRTARQAGSATQVRHPGVGDLGQQVRYRLSSSTHL